METRKQAKILVSGLAAAAALLGTPAVRAMEYPATVKCSGQSEIPVAAAVKSSQTVGNLKCDEKVTVQFVTESGWALIQTENGVRGFVDRPFLSSALIPSATDSLPAEAPTQYCTDYFVVAYVPDFVGAPAVPDSAPVSTQVWWEEQGKAKYFGLCWADLATVQQKRLAHYWVLAWTSESVAGGPPAPADLMELLNTPRRSAASVPAEVTGRFFRLVAQEAIQTPDGSFQMGRVVFSQSASAKQYDKAFRRALWVVKRLGR